MNTVQELKQLLKSIDHRSYPAYKDVTGAWRFQNYVLVVDHVQGDPFASPSHVHVEVPLHYTGFPERLLTGDASKRALCDMLTRFMSKEFERYNFKAKGSGKSGLLAISRPGQEVLSRSACQVTEQKLVLRFFVGFPAYGRSCNALDLEKILCDYLPKCVDAALVWKNLNQDTLTNAIELSEDQESLRQQMKEANLVAFVADGAILPRKSGISELPMKDAVPFATPSTMKQEFLLPHKGRITGMGIPAGITLIVGGGYHGKSTLLEAIQNGVYDHIAGDGREYVLTDPTAMKIRAEDGRSVRRVDISMFINDLPNGTDTTCFSTEDASGSTSQAASTVEALEAGAKVLLIDEDTSATNFMVRDAFMQQVIAREKEPITPFIERMRALWEQEGISTILVAGSSGAFFHVADHVLMLDCYHTLDITDRVRTLCSEHATTDHTSTTNMVQADEGSLTFKVPDLSRTLPAFHRKEEKRKNYNGRGTHTVRNAHMKVRCSHLEEFSLDHETINVRYLEQLVDSEQVEGLALLTRWILENCMDGKRTVTEQVVSAYKTLTEKGWEQLTGKEIPCGIAKPRIQELYCVLNRFRG